MESYGRSDAEIRFDLEQAALSVVVLFEDLSLYYRKHIDMDGAARLMYALENGWDSSWIRRNAYWLLNRGIAPIVQNYERKRIDAVIKEIDNA